MEFKDELELTQLKETVARLVNFGHRGSATDEERLAGEWLKGQLESIGVPTELESFRGSNSYGMRILVHLVFGAASWALLFWSPLASLLVSLATLVSFMLETLAIPRGISSLISARESQNVVGRISAKQPRKRIIVCAHVDTQRAGWIWKTDRIKSFVSGLGSEPGPIKAPLFSMTFVLALQIAVGLWAIVRILRLKWGWSLPSRSRSRRKPMGWRSWFVGFRVSP